MGRASRAKGAGGERELARMIAAAGFEAERNARNGLRTEDIAHSIPGVWVEAKRAERWDIHEWWAQTLAGADSADRSPLLAMRRNRGRWVAQVDLEWLLHELHDLMVFRA